MAVDTPATIAVLGAGPIGLEVALYGRFLGYDVHIYERGRVAENVLAWGHVRMFSPFGCNCSSLGRAALHAQDEATRLPGEDEYLTGRQWVERYLLPLAHTDLLIDNLHEHCEVQCVSRWDFHKGELLNNEDRGDSPFRLLVQDAQGRERADSADIVIDATGVFRTPNRLGPGGGPALGENELKSAIAYGLPDVAGDERDHYIGRRILLVGSGFSAATTAVALARLAEQSPSTRISWITRSRSEDGQREPLGRLENDRLPLRDELAGAANALALDPNSCVDWRPGWRIDAIARDDGEFAVTMSKCEHDDGREETTVLRFDRIIANVGYHPDHGLYSELHFHPCYATDGPIRLAATLLESSTADCLDQPAPGPQVLVTPEPNFYVLGAKSYGRNSHFLFMAGLQQIRDLFSIIGDRANLNLYTTARQLPQ